MRGPDQERLCHPCGVAYSQEKKAAEKSGKAMQHKWRTRKRYQSKKSPNEPCGNCGAARIGKRDKGPNDEPLCNACYQAYRKAKNIAEAAGDSVGDAWRDRPGLRRSARGPRTRGGKKQTAMSGKNLSAEQTDRSGQRDLGGPVEIVGEQTPAGFHPRATKLPPMDPAGDDPRCDDCGTILSASTSDDQDLCESCLRRHDAFDRAGQPTPPRLRNSTIRAFPRHSFLRLQQLAIESFRESRPDFRADHHDEQPGTSPEIYYRYSQAELRQEMVNRGIPYYWLNDYADVGKMINMLQIEDARRGLLPRPRSTDASKYHNMYYMNLRQLASKRGYAMIRKSNLNDADAATLVSFLLEQDAPSTAFEDEIDAASMAEVVRILLDDLAESLTLSSDGPKPRARTTHNRGIYGTVEALNSLSDTLMQNWFPTRTSAAGFLCGPRALAISLEARRFQWRWDHREAKQQLPMLNADDLMELLFDDYEPDEFVPPGTLGTPTQLYAAYIQSMIGHLHEEDPAAYQDLLNDTYLAMNDLNIQQLEAILELLWDGGMIEEHYGLGVVTGMFLAVAWAF